MEFKAPWPAEGEEDQVPDLVPPPTLRWGMGHIPDVPDTRDVEFNTERMFGAGPHYPLAASISHLVESIADQGQTNSCVAQATVSAVEARLVKVGRRARLSRSVPYKVARALARSSVATPLVDDGCYPRSLFRGAKDVGFVPEAIAPFDPDTINSELDWDQIKSASAGKISSWHRIDVTGAARLEQIAIAISKSYPIVFGTAVGDRFQDWAGTATANELLRAEPNKSTRGGHMLGIYAYRQGRNGMEFLILNSYGPTWGAGGWAWVDADFVLDPRASDFYLIEVA